MTYPGNTPARVAPLDDEDEATVLLKVVTTMQWADWIHISDAATFGLDGKGVTCQAEVDQWLAMIVEAELVGFVLKANKRTPSSAMFNWSNVVSITGTYREPQALVNA